MQQTLTSLLADLKGQDQWFPTRGSGTLWVQKRFLSVRHVILQVGSCMLFNVLLFKTTEICESLHVLLLKRTLSHLIIRGNVTYLNGYIVCIAVSAHAEVTRLKMATDAIVCTCDV